MLQLLYQPPPGIVALFAGATIPDGWLECAGQAVSRSTYAALFNIIGTTWGAGDGATTFNLPDIRGRASIGVGAGTGLTARALAATGGAEIHTLTTAEIPAHEHGPGGTATSFIVAGINTAPVGTGASNWGTRTTTDSAGGGGAHNNMMPWIALKFIIKT